MVEETAKIQSREARRRREQDAAMAAEYLRGKVRQKVAVFSDLVGRMEENQSSRLDDVQDRRTRSGRAGGKDRGNSHSSIVPGKRESRSGGEMDVQQQQQGVYGEKGRRDDDSEGYYIDW